jgi:hypothetical protein
VLSIHILLYSQTLKYRFVWQMGGGGLYLDARASDFGGIDNGGGGGGSIEVYTQ